MLYGWTRTVHELKMGMISTSAAGTTRQHYFANFIKYEEFHVRAFPRVAVSGARSLE